jgi:hypothetical protein
LPRSPLSGLVSGGTAMTVTAGIADCAPAAVAKPSKTIGIRRFIDLS